MKQLVYGVVLILVAIGGIYLFGMKNNEVTVPAQVNETVTVEGVGQPQGEVPESGVATLTELAQKQESMECQIRFERSEAEGAIEGTYFTHAGKIRGDFMVPTEEFGGEIVSSVIVDTDMLFVWTTIAQETIGFKSDLATRDTSVPTKEPIPLDAPVRYSCTQWTLVDGSVFIPPAEVTFRDSEASVRAGMEYGTLP